MTTLLQGCQDLDTKLKALELAKRGVEDLQHIQQRTEEWSARNAKLKRIQAQTRPLVLATEDSTAVASKQLGLRQNAAKVLARLEANEDIKKLTLDDAWTRLLKASEGVAEALEAAGRNAWSALLEQQGSLENPGTLRLRTPPTPQNEAALRTYQSSHAAYEVIARLPLPRTHDDVAQLDTHVAACKAAYKRLTFDLPPEVSAFFEALQSDSATLTHVTPRVLAWLAEQNQLGRFRVRGARQ